MERYYDAHNERMVWVAQTADAAFWDGHWQTDELAAVVRSGNNSLVVPETRRRLPSGSVVLEGGCGNARYVYALAEAGYRSVGLDFARTTLRQVRGVAPGLCLVAGDVFALPLADASVDGYWSLGVIEHFWDGYAGIVAEMRRVIRPGGYLFLTYPYLSPLRRAKARFRCYPAWTGTTAPADFYQFALAPRATTAALADAGFVLQDSRPLFGDWGLGQEVPMLKGLLDALARHHGNRLAHLTSATINRLATPFAGHVMLQVFRRGEARP